MTQPNYWLSIDQFLISKLFIIFISLPLAKFVHSLHEDHFLIPLFLGLDLHRFASLCQAQFYYHPYINRQILYKEMKLIILKNWSAETLSHTCEEAKELISFPFHWTNILTSKQCSINLKKCKLDESGKKLQPCEVGGAPVNLAQLRFS